MKSAKLAAAATRNTSDGRPNPSDRTISEYASGVWNVEPCPIN